MFANAVAERVSLEQLHGYEGTSLIVIDLVNGADIWMIEGRRGSRFAFEALQGPRIAHRMIRKKLQGNQTAEADVLCLIDDTHAARTEFFPKAIVRNNLFVHWRAALTGPR